METGETVNVEQLSFEDALKRLEEIVRTLEKGEAPSIDRSSFIRRATGCADIARLVSRMLRRGSSKSLLKRRQARGPQAFRCRLRRSTGLPTS